MKKLFAIVLIAIIAVSLTACSNDEPTTIPTIATMAETQAQTEAETQATTDSEDSDNAPAENPFKSAVETSSDPDAWKKYQAPTALTDNILDYTFRLDNKLYSLPCPASEFIDNGWEVNTKADTVLAGNSYTGGLTLEKDGHLLTTSVKNFSDVDLSPIETTVISFSLNSDFYSDMDCELSGGITFGMSVDEVKSKIDMDHFEEKTLTSGNIELSHSENSNMTYLTFEDGKLTEIRIEKNLF